MRVCANNTIVCALSAGPSWRLGPNGSMHGEKSVRFEFFFVT